MKKIATLTFTDTPNYGALLQAYALRRYIADCGFDCQVLNYQNKNRKFAQVKGIRRFRSMIWQYTLSPLFTNRERTKATKWFRNNLLHQTQDIYTDFDSLKKSNIVFDGFVVGSDQVWNPQNNANDPAYLLKFVDNGKIRISYAASFGTDKVNKDYLIRNEELFDNIDYISVREQSGQIQLEDILGIEATVVLDPVFLISKEKWEELLDRHSCYKEDEEFILCYVLPGNSDVEKKIYKTAENLAEKCSLPVYTLGKKTTDKGFLREKLIHNSGPLEFLAYLRKAKYVITNSFHGTAFSIIFQKNFWCVMGTGALGVRNTRLINLLENTGLNDRVLICDELREMNFTKPIDYSVCNELLQRAIIDSQNFLEAALDNKEEVV